MLMTGRDVHLLDLLKMFSKRRYVILIFFSVTFTAVLLRTFLATPLYEGSTKVLIEKGDAGNLTGRFQYGTYDPEFYETQYQLIKSRAVARRVVDMLGMSPDAGDGNNAGISFPGFVKSKLGGMLKAFLGLFGGSHPETGLTADAWADNMADALSYGIRVRPVAESRIVDISYTSSDPAFAALVANTTARAFIEETLNMKMDSTRRTLEWMNKKAQVEREKLEAAERALQQYMQANGIITLENRVTVAPEELSELATQLVRAESKRKEIESLYAKVRQVANDPSAAETVSVIASDPALQTLRAQTVEAEKAMMELSGKFGPKHPAMQKAASDLDILRQKKAQEVRRIVQTIRIEYELALANEANLRGLLGRTKSETHQLNERFIRYGALKREVDTSRQLYDALMLKLKEQSVNEENQPVNLWIVEEANIPTMPVSPKKGLNILLGLVLGVFGGFGLALFVEYLDNKIKDPDETEAALDTPILGVVPLCREKDGEIEGIVLRSPLSSFAENYKTLRSVLTLSTDEGTPHRILITSPSMGEGKTSTTVNLAMVLAQTDKQVVLIDGDLRKPRLHQVFRTANDIGLSTYLAGASTGGILRKGPLPNLSLITSGPLPPNPAELVASQRMRSLIDFLSDKFDYIICDSPPLLVVSDARVLSRNFDGTIVVVKAHQTSNEMAARAVKSLRDLNARILGLVINGMHPRNEEYYYGEYHSGVDKPVTKTRYASGAAVGEKSS